MGKDYFVEIMMNNGYQYQGVTSMNLNRIALLRLLPITINLRDPFYLKTRPAGYRQDYLKRPEKIYADYKQEIERYIREKPSDTFMSRSIKVIPQTINTIIFCEEVSELERKLQRE